MRYPCALVVSLFGLAGTARGVDVVQVNWSPYQAGLGGEFAVVPVSGNSPGSTALPADLALDSLQSFCMQATVPIELGASYIFAFSTGVTTGMGFDPLDERTAYLYTNFRNGTLTGYDYGAGRQASAAALQEAIWFIEDEPYGVNNSFVTLANTAVASGGVWEGKGIGDVRVLALNFLDGSDAQDQLTIVPSQGAFALVGVAGFVLARRRRD